MEKNYNNLQTVYAGQGGVLGGKLHTDTTIRLESKRFTINIQMDILGFRTPLLQQPFSLNQEFIVDRM